jgi:A/G-specific adenine glycosylase
MPKASTTKAPKPSAKKSAKKRAAKTKLPFDVAEFRALLHGWYRKHARRLPWRGVDDPYATWLSEIMLQQTRVATVIERYKEFLLRFPTLQDLADAPEDDVLALWSGLGYYRRARMLHRAAQFVVRELGGVLPGNAVQLRSLPGVGFYTAAAIASISFGESIAVLDGNVERVLLRVLGKTEDRSAQAQKLLMETAQQLVPAASKAANVNAPGEHNQAMMELGATVCVPRGPLCMQCPVFALCKTRGEHTTVPRGKQQSRDVVYLVAVRKQQASTEVLLVRRAKDAAQMPQMLELPALPLEAVSGREPVLRVRHAITNTNFYVQIFTETVLANITGPESLSAQIVAAAEALEWTPVSRLSFLPITGLTRKVLQRLDLMVLPKMRIPSV